MLTSPPTFQYIHGHRISYSQDIIRDSQSIVAFFTLGFQEKANVILQLQIFALPNFLNADQWNVLVNKWNIHRSSFYRILVCFKGSHKCLLG